MTDIPVDVARGEYVCLQTHCLRDQLSFRHYFAIRCAKQHIDLSTYSKVDARTNWPSSAVSGADLRVEVSMELPDVNPVAWGDLFASIAPFLGLQAVTSADFDDRCPTPGLSVSGKPALEPSVKGVVSWEDVHSYLPSLLRPRVCSAS